MVIMSLLHHCTLDKTIFFFAAFFFLSYFFLILIVKFNFYNVVLVSAIQQHESAIGIHIAPPS